MYDVERPGYIKADVFHTVKVTGLTNFHEHEHVLKCASKSELWWSRILSIYEQKLNQTKASAV